MSRKPIKYRPVALYLPDEEKWVNQQKEAEAYFKKAGLKDIYWVPGVHAKKFGIRGTHIYLLDGRPEEQFFVGEPNVGNFLSQYICFSVMSALPGDHFMYLEGDCRFVRGWQKKLEKALKDVPADFDFLYVGSSCAKNKQPVRVGKSDVYEFPYRGESQWDWYPQATHCYIVAKKCLEFVMSTQRDTATPTDISLIRHSFPKLKVFAILPRLADQGDATALTE